MLRNFLKENANFSPTLMRLRSGRALTPNANSASLTPIPLVVVVLESTYVVNSQNEASGNHTPMLRAQRVSKIPILVSLRIEEA